jgi:hypothetical protein
MKTVYSNTSAWDLKHDSPLKIKILIGDLKIIYQFQVLYKTD